MHDDLDPVEDRKRRGRRRNAARGLCEGCRWAREVVSGRGSVFLLCGRHQSDPRFAKYPPLPVLACVGFEPPSELPNELRGEHEEHREQP